MGKPILRTEGITKQFGELVAVDSVSLELEDDECLAVIGPNGAGKTTLFNLLTGVYEPTKGDLYFKDEQITGSSVTEIASLGIARSYQITNFFPELTAIENIRLATQIESADGFALSDITKHYSEDRKPIDKAMAIMERLGIEEIAEEKAGTLAHGQKRHLEVGIALGLDPDALLLDEPTAGMSPTETGETKDLINEITDEIPTLLVEHDMDVVMDISDRIAVLNQGELIAIGAPEEIQEDERVQKAYLSGGPVV